MNRIANLYNSTIGKKMIAAVTGIILFGFLIGHVAGNLKVFTGTSSNGVPHIDEYGQFLKEVGTPILPYMVGLWIARAVLLGSFVLHILVVIQLAMLSSEARPVGYVKSKKAVASLPALYMMFSGLLILGFVVFHLFHFTTGHVPLPEGEFAHGYVYNNLSNSFTNPLVAIGYCIVMVVLAFHLYHGVWSLFQTLGLDNPDRNQALRVFAIVAAVGLAAGFAAVPISFMSGNMPAPVEYAHELLKSH